MTDLRAHEPKLAALRAYAAGALRAPGRARLERHLAQCATCAEALEGLGRYRKLAPAAEADALVPAALAAIDWARVESAVALEVARAARRRRIRTLSFVGAGLAAAAWLAFGLRAAQPVARVEAPRRSDALEHTARPTLAPLRAEITAIVGTASATRVGGRSEPITLDSLPAEGWTLETGPGSELHVALAETAAFVVAAETSLTLHVLRQGQVELGLTRGAVTSQVLPRKPGEGYAVLASGRRVRVHGTRFGVESSAQELAVQVDEGAVDVLSADGELLVALQAPQRWVQEVDAPGHARPVANGLRRPRQAVAGSAAWPAFTVPVWPSVARWQIDGADVPATGELRMRVPPGQLKVIGQLADGRSMRGELRVDALGARFDPSALRFVPAPKSAAAAAPTASGGLDSASASSVIRMSQRALQRCYERSMRDQPPGAASIVRLRLRIALDSRGAVRELVFADGDLAPADLIACVRRVAHAWRFPAPGGSGVVFEAPLRFRPLR